MMLLVEKIQQCADIEEEKKKIHRLSCLEDKQTLSLKLN